MNGYVKLTYGAIGRALERQTKQTKALQVKLHQANMPMRAAAYLSALYATAALLALVGALFGLALALALPNTPPLFLALAPLAIGAFVGGMAVALGPLWLENVITERAREIDENLPHGLTYMLALAHAGLPPRDIWRSLAEARVFGGLAVEAERIVRDLDLFGYDLVKALRLAQDRSPSKRFHEFLQGAISAFQSGVDLPEYLRSKAAQYQHEETERQLQTLDSMGVMAETFLVVVVAAPLFLIILLTVMSINQGASVLLWGFMLSLVFIPVTQVIIGALIKSMNPKVWS